MKRNNSTYMFKEAGEVFYILAHDNGEVSIRQNINEEETERRYHVHDQFVTDIKPLNDSRFVTCSEDGKIKLWRLSAAEDYKLNQIGEFFGFGPAITCLDVDADENIVVGDAAGNLFFLQIF